MPDAHSSPASTAIFEILDQYQVSGKFPDESAALEFREASIEHYRAFRHSPADDTRTRFTTNLRALRGYATLASSTVALSNSDLEREDEVYEGNGYVLGLMRSRVLGPLMYGDHYVDVDPLSFEVYFGEPTNRNSRWIVANRVADSSWQLKRIRPLVEAGIVELAPLPADEESPFEDPSDEAAFTAFLERRTGTPSSVDRGTLWYLRDAARFAEENGAVLVPDCQLDARYIEYLHANRGAQDAEAMRVAAGLIHFDLPNFADVPIQTLIAVHRDQEAVSGWRVALRDAARTIRAECDDPDFDAKAILVYRDLLEPRAADLRRLARTFPKLSEAAREQPLRVGLGAAFGASSNLLLGLPPQAALGSAVAVGLVNMIAGATHRPRPQGVSAVISMLVRADRSRER